MRLSQVMSASDWQLTRQVAAQYGVDPLLLAAIGWHETHWGRLGAGRNGWHLGYAYYPGSTLKDQYKGLDRQLHGAASHVQRHFRGPLTYENLLQYSRNAWRAGDPDAWARSVWTIYTNLVDDLTGADTSPSVTVGGINLDDLPWDQVAARNLDGQRLAQVGLLVALIIIILAD